MREYRKYSLLSLFSLIFVLVACGGKETFTIAIMADFTGPNSVLGVSCRDAVNFKLQKYNSDPSSHYNIEVEYFDSQSSIDVVQGHLKTIEEQKIPIIIGPMISHFADTMLEYSNKDFLILSPTMSTAKLEGKDDNLIRFINSSTEQGDTMAKYASKTGYKNIVIIYDGNNYDYTYETAKRFYDVYLESNPDSELTFLEINTAPYENIQSIQTVLSANVPDAVILVCNGRDGALIAQMLFKNSSNPQLFGSVWVNTKDFIELGGKAVEGAILCGNEENLEGNKKIDKFNADFYEYSGKQANFSTILSYETITVLIDALESTQSFDIKKIKASIINKKYDILFSSFYVNSTGEVNRATILYKVVNGEIVEVKK